MADNIITANRLPGITWNWLKMNDVSIDAGGIKGEGTLAVNAPDNIKFSGFDPEEAKALTSVETGMGKETEELFEKIVASSKDILVEKGVKAASTVFIKPEYTKDSSVGSVNVVAREDSDVVLIADLTEIDQNISDVGIQTKILIKDRARVKLVQLYNLGKETSLISNIGAEVGEEARFELIQIFLGGKNVNAGCLADLKGDKASFYERTGYKAETGAKYDFNYVARHEGKKTEADIHANGVMYQDSYKLMRQTIDFLRGCSESKGAEREEVLLMDENLVNKSIPLILCKEEDVEGEHGASIGKISDEILFYLRARGLSDESIYDLMANGKILTVISEIDDAEYEKKLTEILAGETIDEEE